MSAIPLADAPVLRRRARLAHALRIVLAAAAIGLALAFVVVSRHPHTQTIAGLPHDSSTVVVLDLSASISTDTYARIGGTLASLSHSGQRIGLVVFSDIAYEALPPGLPASTLAPLVRYFTLPEQSRPGFAPSFPPNPWTNAFSAGTKISAGLDLAHAIATAQPRRPAVVLVSDLDDDPDDLGRVTTVVAAYRRDDVPVRIVALDASEQNVAFFRRILGPDTPIAQAPTLAETPSHDVTAFPVALLVLALAAALALALREAWAPRLEWSRG